MLKKIRLYALALAFLALSILSIDYFTREYFARVTQVTDGDTIKVKMGFIWTVTEKIRLIGINTPETKAPGKPVECFGPEASAKTKALLSGKTVRLEQDPKVDNRDKYLRLLRYVHLYFEDLSVNEKLLREGFARESSYGTHYERQKEFKNAETKAKKDNLGLWGACPVKK